MLRYISPLLAFGSCGANDMASVLKTIIFGFNAFIYICVGECSLLIAGTHGICNSIIFALAGLQCRVSRTSATKERGL